MIIYTTVIRAGELTWLLFDEMQQQGLEPNVITYTTVISAGLLTLQLLVELRQQGLQPNVVTFSAVVSAWRKCKMPQRVLQLFEEMQQQGLEPNVITYTAVISAGGLTLQLFNRCGSRDFAPLGLPTPR